MIANLFADFSMLGFLLLLAVFFVVTALASE
jgi:hypothetical protein